MRKKRKIERPGPRRVWSGDDWQLAETTTFSLLPARRRIAERRRAGRRRGWIGRLVAFRRAPTDSESAARNDECLHKVQIVQ